jgi:putative peptidoglycan lipid II flippase
VALLFPVGALLVALRLPVTRAVYERGAFDAGATALTGQALWAYAVGLPFMGGSLIVMQAAYAARQYRRLLVIRTAALGLKFAAGLALIPALGHAGIALGTSAFHAFVLAALIPGVAGGWRGAIPRPPVLLLAVALAVGTGWGVTALMSGAGAVRGLSALGVQALAWGSAGVVYLGTCRVGRVEEVLGAERLVVRRLFGREARA